jgi:hypothetical protein
MRKRVLEDCCLRIQVLASSRSVLVLVRAMPVDEYQEFLPSLTTIATEIFEIEEKSNNEAVQYSLL